MIETLVQIVIPVVTALVTVLFLLGIVILAATETANLTKFIYTKVRRKL